MIKYFFFLSILFFLLLPLSAWGATIYVINDPETAGKICYLSGGFPVVSGGACTSGTKNSNLETANGAVGAGGGTMILTAGTYTGTQLGSTSGRFRTQRANQLIRPASAAEDSGVGGYLSAYAGTVILDGAGAAATTLQSGYASTEVRDITFGAPANANASVTVTVSGLTLTRPKSIIGTGSTASLFLDSNCAAACTSTISELLHTSGNKLIGNSINNNHVPTFNYSRIHGPATQVYNTAAVFNNPIITGTAGVWFTTSANTGLAVTWNNPIFYGNSLTTGSAHILNQTNTSAWTINNGMTLGNPWNTDTYNYNGVTINNSIQNADPKFVSPRYPAVFVFMVDDRGMEGDGLTGIEYVDDVLPKLVAYGWRGSYALNYTDGLSAGQWASVNIFATAGHEIVNHGRNGASVSNGTGIPSPFSILKSGQTVTIDATNITVSGQTAIPLAGHTMAQLQAHLSADAGCTISAVDTTFDYTPATVLTAVAGQSINTAYATAVTQSTFYAEEIDNAKTDIESHISGYTVTTFAPYGNYTHEALQTYLSTRYTGARGSTITSTLASMNAYNLNVRMLSTTIGDTDTCTGAGSTRDECVRRNTASYIGQAQEQGRIWVFYAHNPTEFALADWDSMLAVVSASNIQVKTLTEAATYTKTYDPSGDIATVDNITYTRTLINASDYRLLPTSPAIDVGTDVSLTTDYAGDPIYGTPDIGGYEYQPPYTFAVNSIPTTGSVRLYSDGKYRMLTATTTTATSSFSVIPASGSYLSTTTQYMDISIDSWLTSGTKNKQWTASSTSGTFKTLATSTIYTIGDLAASKYYQFKLDGVASSTAITGYGSTSCTNGICLSDSSGQIQFTYTGGYSTHTFALEQNTDAPTNVGISSVTVDSTSQLTIAALTASDADPGLHSTPYYFSESTGHAGGSSSSWQNSTTFIDTGLSSNTQYTYQVKAKDANSNESAFSTATSTYTLAPTPTNLAGTAGLTTMDLSVDSFTNVTADSSGYYFSRTGANSGWITTNSWSDSGLSCNTSYTYSVIYRNGDGTETNAISLTKSTNGCGGGGMPSEWYNPPKAPIGGFNISINNGAESTTIPIVILNLKGGSDTARMALSNFSDFRDAGLENYTSTSTKLWNLCWKSSMLQIPSTCPVGTYTVYAKFYAPWGTNSGIVSDTIVLKTSATNIGIDKPTPITNPPASPSVGIFTQTLKYGSNNKQVIWLQDILKKFGFFSQSIKSNGNFGPTTKQSVQKFQCQYNLVCSGNERTTGYGQVGPKTRQVLNQLNH